MSTALKLYVVRGTPSSDRALAALDGLRQGLGDDARIEVVDLSEQPEVAERERIVATPMLVRLSPAPVLRIIGDLTDHEKVRWGLGLGDAA